LFASAVLVAGVTRIEDDVILWGQVAINKDLTIGKGAVVLAVSAVDKDMEGGKTYFGAPAVEVRQKWKEMAMMRKLPEMFEKLNKLTKDAEKAG
jgi:UDP-3-O-[3-hydroxymyristoyl] glucosamine N-acyltransferase